MELINQNNNIFGCFVCDPPVNYDAKEEDRIDASNKGDIFREYIWGDNGIDHVLKELVNIEYGKDVRLILFQFLLNPFPFQLSHIKEIENYRKDEKSIGVNIIITNTNFFNKTHQDRIKFLESSILDRLKILESKYHKKIDTRFDLIVRELKKRFSSPDIAST